MWVGRIWQGILWPLMDLQDAHFLRTYRGPRTAVSKKGVLERGRGRGGRARCCQEILGLHYILGVGGAGSASMKNLLCSYGAVAEDTISPITTPTTPI